MGDCVAVERGGFNNLRLVDDSRCARNMKPTRPAVNEANACVTAKDQLLAARRLKKDSTVPSAGCASFVASRAADADPRITADS